MDTTSSAQSTSETLFFALKKHFGFIEFRPLQKEIVQTILSGRDCLAILPTGGGKSLCFQLPGLLLSGVTIVITPLISLMTDQVFQLRQKSIQAIALSSALSFSELQRAEQDISNQKYKFIYVSPEKLATQSFKKILHNLTVSMIVIDEAHCISEWGHQFRPQYLAIHENFQQLAQRPIIAAFTASATPRTINDISEQLHLQNPQHFRQSVFRKNLALHVVPCPSHTVQHIVLLRLLKRHPQQAIIVYCATRAQTEDTTYYLQKSGYPSAAYHAGMDTKKRQEIQEQFIKSELQIICATTAFGMGVDKSNIRAEIHLNLPASMEGYYQEVGRAGRDGQESFCYLLTLQGDDQLQAEICSRAYPPAQCSKALITYVIKHKNCDQFSLRVIAEAMTAVEEEKSLWMTLKKGEEKGWWKVDWHRRILYITQPLSTTVRHWKKLQKLQLHQLEKVQRISDFCQTQRCRQQLLIEYFESPEQHTAKIRCGTCDNCTQQFHAGPTENEQQYFASAEKQFLAADKNATPLLLHGLCKEVITSLQPDDLQQVAWLGIFGRGMQKRWASTRLSKSLTTHTLDTTQRQQNHVDDSTHASRSTK